MIEAVLKHEFDCERALDHLLKKGEYAEGN